jgi:hypothetical protein
MCFSSQASFVAGCTLILLGLASIRQVRKAHKRLLPLALTPVLFGIQQLLEGSIWLGLQATPRNETLYALGLHGFTWLAFFWWPWFLAFALGYAEPNKLRQHYIYALSLCGVLVGAYLIEPSCAAEIIGNHIAYFNNHSSALSLMLYLITGITPFFISSIRFMWMIGALILGGLAISLLAYLTWATSIWCFFAALTSTCIYGLLSILTKSKN